MSVQLFRREIKKRGVNVTLQNRAIQSPVFGNVDFDETFSNDTIVKALICTVTGSTIFDGVNTDTPITHKLTIAHLDGVNSETWVLLSDGRRLDVVRAENVNESNVCLVLHCNERGSGEAAKL